MKAGADKLGYKERHTGRMAINSVERDGRNSCHQTGFCFQGCKWGAKWSTLYTEIPKGEATGNLEVRPDSHVAHIEHDASGKVTGVVYFDKSGKIQRQKARVVAVAGIVRDEARLDVKRGFVGGYELETLSLGLPFMAAFLNPGAWGREFTTGGAENPTLTIVTLAIRQAEFIAGEMKTNAI